jgi:hypothetical protein
MPTLRRLTALLSGLLLQLTLLGIDRPCDVHASPVDRANVAATVAAHGAHEASPMRTPIDECDVERATGDCATMPSCATTLTIPTGLVTVVTHAATSDAIPEPDAVHSQPTTGPDVPPPRG